MGGLLILMPRSISNRRFLLNDLFFIILLHTCASVTGIEKTQSVLINIFKDKP